MNEELQKRIEAILSQSDIVWERYGSDTIEKLAARIVNSLGKSITDPFVFLPWKNKLPKSSISVVKKSAEFVLFA